jgi:hypothetical protein
MSSGMLRRVALVRTDVSEELSASFIRVTRIGELGTTVALISNRRTLRRYTKRGIWYFFEAILQTFVSLILDRLYIRRQVWNCRVL